MWRNFILILSRDQGHMFVSYTFKIKRKWVNPIKKSSMLLDFKSHIPSEEWGESLKMFPEIDNHLIKYKPAFLRYLYSDKI